VDSIVLNKLARIVESTSVERHFEGPSESDNYSQGGARGNTNPACYEILRRAPYLYGSYETTYE
jgi:hypothetical protein